MTLNEARALVTLAAHTRDRITLGRNGVRWTGVPTGLFTEPAIRLEQEDGGVVVIVLDGTEVLPDA